MTLSKPSFLSLSVLAACAALAHQSQAETAPASPVSAKADQGYIKFASADGNYELKLDGRVQLDFGSVDSEKNQDQSDTDFRRIRLALKTKLWKDWQTEMDIDFAESQISISDMWLAYNAVPNWSFKVGNFKPHFSIDQVTSSRFSTFMERSIATELVKTSRRIGLAATYAKDQLFFGTGLFGDPVNEGLEDDERYNPDGAQNSERLGYSLRTVYRPWSENNLNRLLHLGFNYLNQAPETMTSEGRNDGALRFRTYPESRLNETRQLTTGRMHGSDSATTLGLELVGKFDRHMFISEYLQTSVSFDSANYTSSIPDAEFDGYYLAYSFFISGDREYDPSSAEFAAVSGMNALEFTLRFSNANLNDPDGGNTERRSAIDGEQIAPEIGIAGGEADILTLGMNWYPNPNIMIRANYSMADFDENATAGGDVEGGDKLKILGMRVQFTF